MKRLNVKLPEGEIPQAYKDLTEVSLEKDKPDLLRQISSKTLSGYNLKKIQY